MSARTAGPLLVLPVAAALLAACGDAGGSTDAVEDRLAAVTAAYYDGLAGGDAEAVRGALCRAERDGFDADEFTGAPPGRTELVELREVRVEGDSAQAIAVLTSADAEDRRLTYPLQYRYEDGWTLC